MRNRQEWHNRLIWIQGREPQVKYLENQVIIVLVNSCEIELISGQKILLYLHWRVFLARSLSGILACPSFGLHSVHV